MLVETGALMMDADTHIDECEDTWSYWPESELDLQPRTIEFTPDQEPPWMTVQGSGSRHSRSWFIDGQLISRRYRNDKNSGTTIATRELYDVPARLADMDSLGIDVHVLYPTAFLTELTLRPYLMTMLCQSYNRWLADRCAESGGRLRWVAMIPYLATSEALAEVRWAKEHGAVGLFKRGVECGHLPAADPVFWPVYKLASELDLPMCIHVGAEWRPQNNNLTRFPFPDGFEGQQAFRSLVDQKIPQRFPDLRVGFIEFGSAWLPHIFPFIRSNETLESCNFWVTCEVSEDLGYIISKVGDDRLMVGSDYSHADRASVKDAHGRVHSRDDIGESSAQKLTISNAKEFYRL